MKTRDPSDNQPMILTHSYIPARAPDLESGKYAEQTTRYRIEERNRLIKVARGELTTHMHSTIHACDKSCPGHTSKVEKTKLKAQRSLSDMGVDWQHEKIEEQYARLQTIQTKENPAKDQGNSYDARNNASSKQSALISNSIFTREQMQEQIPSNSLDGQCLIL